MEELLAVLKELAEKFKPQIIDNAKKAIDATHRDALPLFDYVFRVYYSKTDSGGRWYDPYHVAYSVIFAAELVNALEVSSLIIPSIILHDIGYHSPWVDKEAWSSKNSRIIHMQEGAALAIEILSKSGGQYTDTMLGEIVGMVASHDNSYLGIVTSDPHRLALRDCDRAWVMHPLSFYKDWIVQRGREGGFFLSDLFLFQSRLTSFYGPEEPYPPKWGPKGWFDFEDMIQPPPFTELAEQWRDRQFAARFQEIQNNISQDANIFRRAIEDHIRAELAAGRG